MHWNHVEVYARQTLKHKSAIAKKTWNPHSIITMLNPLKEDCSTGRWDSKLDLKHDNIPRTLPFMIKYCRTSHAALKHHLQGEVLWALFICWPESDSILAMASLCCLGETSFSRRYKKTTKNFIMLKITALRNYT